MAREAYPELGAFFRAMSYLWLFLVGPLMCAWIFAIVFSAITPHCLLGFDCVDTFVLPDFRNLSKSVNSTLLDGKYRLPQKYFLKMVIEDDNSYELCVLTDPSDASTASPCMVIGRVDHSIPCNRSMRADCLPGAIIDSYFGLSVWNQDNASVQYLSITLNPSSGGDVSMYTQNLTNTTSFSEIWYRVLGCERIIALDISCLVATVPYIIIWCVISPLCVGYCYLKSKWRISFLNGDGSERAPLIPRIVPPIVHTLWSDQLQALLQDVEEKVVPKVAADWESLAIYLDVEPTRIDIIKRSSQHQYEYSCREMFRSWMKKDRGTGRQPRTWDSVVQAIRRMGREDLAEQLTVPPTSTSLVPCTPTETASSLSVCLPPARVTSAPLDPLRQKPMFKDLNSKVVVRVAGNWVTTGLQLNIEDYVLQAIKTPNGSNEYHCREMFRCWLAREEGCGTLPRTWSSVLHAVENSCGSEVSREIKELIL